MHVKRNKIQKIWSKYINNCKYIFVFNYIHIRMIWKAKIKEKKNIFVKFEIFLIISICIVIW